MQFIIYSGTDTYKIVKALALVDSGAGGKFIDQAYVWKLGMKTQKLEQSLIAQNVDGTPNKEKLLPLLFLTLSLTEEPNEPDCLSLD